MPTRPTCTSAHPGSPWAELAQLVRRSAADFRLLVLDASRAGVLTRNKGERQRQPFDIPREHGLGGEGLAFFPASAENELAQASDELRGLFFTQAFVAGSLGAANRDGDSNVVLDEAYNYGYDSTLRAPSRSASDPDPRQLRQEVYAGLLPALPQRVGDRCRSQRRAGRPQLRHARRDRPAGQRTPALTNSNGLQHATSFYDMRGTSCASRVASPPRASRTFIGLSYDLSTRVYLSLESALQSYVLPMPDAKSCKQQLRAAFAWRVARGAENRLCCSHQRRSRVGRTAKRVSNGG